MRGSKQHRGRPTCRVAEDDRAFGPDFVEDDTHVLDVLFETRDLVWSDWIGEAGPARIKENQPAIGGEAPQHPRDGRLLPDLLDMRQGAGAHAQQIGWTGPKRLVCEVNFAVLRVLRLRSGWREQGQSHGRLRVRYRYGCGPPLCAKRRD